MKYVTTTIIDAYTERPMGYMEFRDGSYVIWPPDIRVVENAKGMGIALGAAVVGDGEAMNFLSYHSVSIRQQMGRHQA